VPSRLRGRSVDYGAMLTRSTVVIIGSRSDCSAAPMLRAYAYALGIGFGCELIRRASCTCCC
jgi:hypothetical protein